MSKKDPTIHIKLSDLEKVLTHFKSDIKAYKFFEVASKYNITNRHIIKTTQKSRNKIKRLQDTNEVNVNRFQDKLIRARKQRNHRGITVIKEGDSSYILLREVATIALEFCKTFELGTEKGFSIYISMVLDKSKLFSLSKFKSFKSYVFEKYTQVCIVQDDDSPKRTEEFYNIYLDCVEEKGVKDYELSEIEGANMVLGRQQADRLKANYYDYIQAQFEGMKGLAEIPPLGSFHGIHATSRYKMYNKQTVIEKSAYDDN